MKNITKIIVLLFLIFFIPTIAFSQDGFTQKDRELLIELRVKMVEMEKKFDKRFEQVDKRIDDFRQDVNNRFKEMLGFIQVLAAVLGALVVAIFGFAYWDRRTIIKEARREAIDFIDKEGLLRRLVDALKTLAREDKRLAEVLKSFNIL